MGAGETGGSRRGQWGPVSHRPHARARQHRTLGKPPGQIPSQHGLGFWFETLAKNSRAVAYTPTVYMDELSRGLKTSTFSKSKFSMATLFEWRNLMWNGRCKAVHIFSTIESVERTKLGCEECTQLRCAKRTRLMNVPNCAALNVCGDECTQWRCAEHTRLR